MNLTRFLCHISIKEQKLYNIKIKRLFRTLQLLLDNGATMPTEEETLARVNDDPLEQALARLQWYQSMTSDAYILLTSDDPIETALLWGERLKEQMRHERPVFTSCYEVIHSRLELLLTRLLDCATRKDEIWEALNERAASDGTRRSVSKRGVLSDPMGRLKRVVRLEYQMVTIVKESWSLIFSFAL